MDDKKNGYVYRREDPPHPAVVDVGNGQSLYIYPVWRNGEWIIPKYGISGKRGNCPHCGKGLE